MAASGRAVTPRTSPLAVVALVCGMLCGGLYILSIGISAVEFMLYGGLCCLATFLCGILANQQTRVSGRKLGGMAYAYLGMLLALGFFAYPIGSELWRDITGERRLAAHRDTCLMQLRDLSSSLAMYAQDHSAYPGRNWYLVLHRPVLLFHCPDDTRGDASISYGYNLRLAGSSWSDMHRMDTVPVLADSDTPLHLLRSSADFARTRHTRGCNVVYGDGHAEWVAQDVAVSWTP